MEEEKEKSKIWSTARELSRVESSICSDDIFALKLKSTNEKHFSE
jgi:hypothetical protein